MTWEPSQSQHMTFLGAQRLNRSAAEENWPGLLKDTGDGVFTERLEPTLEVRSPADLLESFLRRCMGTFFIMESMSKSYFWSSVGHSLR